MADEDAQEVLFVIGFDTKQDSAGKLKALGDAAVSTQRQISDSFTSVVTTAVNESKRFVTASKDVLNQIAAQTEKTASKNISAKVQVEIDFEKAKQALITSTKEAQKQANKTVMVDLTDDTKKSIETVAKPTESTKEFVQKIVDNTVKERDKRQATRQRSLAPSELPSSAVELFGAPTAEGVQLLETISVINDELGVGTDEWKEYAATGAAGVAELESAIERVNRIAKSTPEQFQKAFESGEIDKAGANLATVASRVRMAKKEYEVLSDQYDKTTANVKKYEAASEAASQQAVDGALRAGKGVAVLSRAAALLTVATGNTEKVLGATGQSSAAAEKDLLKLVAAGQAAVDVFHGLNETYKGYQQAVGGVTEFLRNQSRASAAARRAQLLERRLSGQRIVALRAETAAIQARTAAENRGAVALRRSRRGGAGLLGAGGGRNQFGGQGIGGVAGLLRQANARGLVGARGFTRNLGGAINPALNATGLSRFTGNLTRVGGGASLGPLLGSAGAAAASLAFMAKSATEAAREVRKHGLLGGATVGSFTDKIASAEVNVTDFAFSLLGARDAIVSGSEAVARAQERAEKSQFVSARQSAVAEIELDGKSAILAAKEQFESERFDVQLSLAGSSKEQLDLVGERIRAFEQANKNLERDLTTSQDVVAADLSPQERNHLRTRQANITAEIGRLRASASQDEQVNSAARLIEGGLFNGISTRIGAALSGTEQKFGGTSLDRSRIAELEKERATNAVRLSGEDVRSNQGAFDLTLSERRIDLENRIAELRKQQQEITVTSIKDSLAAVTAEEEKVQNIVSLRQQERDAAADALKGGAERFNDLSAREQAQLTNALQQGRRGGARQLNEDQRDLLRRFGTDESRRFVGQAELAQAQANPLFRKAGAELNRQFQSARQAAIQAQQDGQASIQTAQQAALDATNNAKATFGVDTQALERAITINAKPTLNINVQLDRDDALRQVEEAIRQKVSQELLGEIDNRQRATEERINRSTDEKIRQALQGGQNRAADSASFGR